MDFEVVYIASSCSLLVVDRGNSAIREIHLNFDDCAHQYETGLPLGMNFDFFWFYFLLNIQQYRFLKVNYMKFLLYASDIFGICSNACWICQDRNSSATCCWFLWLHAGFTPKEGGSNGLYQNCE